MHEALAAPAPSDQSRRLDPLHAATSPVCAIFVSIYMRKKIGRCICFLLYAYKFRIARMFDEKMKSTCIEIKRLI
jgi:hypothetical protein